MGNLWSKPPPPPHPVLTDIPWRNILHEDVHWSKAAHEVLRTNIRSCVSAGEYSQNTNILLLGPISSGKSSFVNSVMSISRGRMVHDAYAGASEKSFTRKYGKHADDYFKNFTLHDCMGLEEGERGGIDINDIIYLIKGNIPKNYKFDQDVPIAEDDPKFVKNPPTEAKMHCVIFCIDATALHHLPRELFKKIRDLQVRLKDMDIPRIMCITKIDKLCGKVNDDLTRTFYSIKVRDVVKRAGEVFKIQQNYVHPIKNYEKEVVTDIQVDMLLMYPLMQVLGFATDYIKKHQ